MRIKDVAPIILTAVSVVSSIAAVVMAVNDTPRAYEYLDNHRLELDPSGETDLELSDKLKDYARGYWRTGVLLGLSITASVASCVIGHKNYKALMATTAAVSAAYSKHKTVVKKFLGEEKAKLIDQMAAKEAKEENKNPTERVWFYDTVSDTYFQMTWQEYWSAKLYANRDINTYGEISLGNMFPGIKECMEDKNCADYEWFIDDILENYGYPWLDITEEPVNMRGSENDPSSYDPHIRDGKPTWVIHYGIWPLPPSIAKDYQYIGSQTRQVTA